MREKISPLNILADALLAACCALAAALIVPTAYSVPFILKTLLLTAFISALVFSALVHVSRKLWPLPCFVMVMWIIFFARAARERIDAGAKLIWYEAGGLISMSFSSVPTPAEPPQLAGPAVSVTYFLALIILAYALVAVILLAKCRPAAPKLLLPVPACVLGFIYYDCTPAVYAIAFLAIYWGGVLFGRDKLKKAKATTELRRLIFIALLALFALILPRLIPESRFEPIPFAERKSFLEVFGAVREGIVSTGKGSPSDYDLKNEGDRVPSGNKVFSVSCTVSGPLYLRAHSYGRYTGVSWPSASDYTGEWSSLEALGNTQHGTLAVCRIRDARTSERLTPYAFLPDDENPEAGESFIRSKGRTAYVWSYLTNVELVPDKISEEEDKYYRFAQKQYTIPNGEFRNGLLGLLEGKLYYDTNSGIYYDAVGILPKLDPYTAARYVAELVRSVGEYTLTPGRTPEGEDFVKYFCEVSKKGYCVHYASTTAAILQALGIPARYVIGYRVEIDHAMEWIDVTDESAHAWAEVYVRGVGWVPVECTPSMGVYMGFTSKTQSPIQPSAKPTDAIPPIEVVTPEPRTPRPTRQPQEAPSAKPTETAVKPAEPSKGPRPKALIWTLAGLFAAVAVWEAIGAYIKKRRQRSFEQEDSHAAVLAMLKYLETIRRYGAMLPPDPEGLANEAAFSNHDMSETRKELYELVRSEQNGIFLFAKFKRFILKYVTFKI